MGFKLPSMTKNQSMVWGGSNLAWQVYKNIQNKQKPLEQAKTPYRPTQWNLPQLTYIKDSYGNEYYFDAVMKIDHSSIVRTTDHPIQNGASISDHAYMLPNTLTLEIGMSDAMDSYTPGQWPVDYTKAVQTIPETIDIKVPLPILDQHTFKIPTGKSVIKPTTKEPAQRSEKSREAYLTLRDLQMNRQPLTVYTRLLGYKNMIIESITVPDDYQTYNGLKCVVTFKQIFMAVVPKVVKKSANPQVSQKNSLGPKNVQTGKSDSPLLQAAEKAVSKLEKAVK